MDARERDLFSSQAKSTFRGGGVLSDMRLFLAISGWRAPHVRIRGGLATSFEEIDIESRVGARASDFSRILGILVHGREMDNFFSTELANGRIPRPPCAQYAVADSMAGHPWLPADETRGRSLGKRMATQQEFNRYAGPHDLAIGKYALYRIRYIIAGDLTDAWGELGGLAAQINHPSIVWDLSITDHAGIAATYGRRIHQMIRKTAPKRPPNTDYFDIMRTLNSDVEAAAIRGLDVRSEALRKEKGGITNGIG